MSVVIHDIKTKLRTCPRPSCRYELGQHTLWLASSEILLLPSHLLTETSPKCNATTVWPHSIVDDTGKRFLMHEMATWQASKTELPISIQTFLQAFVHDLKDRIKSHSLSSLYELLREVETMRIQEHRAFREADLEPFKYLHVATSLASLGFPPRDAMSTEGCVYIFSKGWILRSVQSDLHRRRSPVSAKGAHQTPSTSPIAPSTCQKHPCNGETGTFLSFQRCT